MIVNGASIAASFAGLLWIWEYNKYAKEEKDFLKASLQFSFLKCLYILSRYSMVPVLIFHISFFSVVSTYYPNIPVRFCQWTLIYETAMAYYFMGILNLIMMVRIYALYNKGPTMGALLVFLFIVWVGNAIQASVTAIPKVKFNATCGQTDIQMGGFYIFAFTEIGIQTIYILLTFGRTISIKRALRGAGAAMRAITPLLSRLIHDSWAMLGFVAFSAVSTMVFSADERLLNRVPEITFPFYTMLISTVSCRLILHPRRLAVVPTEVPQPNVVDLDSPWNVSIEMEDLGTGEA